MSSEAAASGGASAPAATAVAASPLQVGLQSGVRGMFLGLVLGTIWGVWEVRRQWAAPCVPCILRACACHRSRPALARGGHVSALRSRRHVLI